MLFYYGTKAHYVTVRLIVYTVIVLDSFPDSWLTIYLAFLLELFTHEILSCVSSFFKMVCKEPSLALCW